MRARFVLAAGLGWLLRAAPVLAGELAFVEMQPNGVGGGVAFAGDAVVAVSPDGAHLYATGTFDDDALFVYARNPSTGVLDFVEVQRDGVNFVDGLDAARGVAVSPDGAHVYAAAFDDRTLAVFARDLPTGALSFVEVQRDGEGGVDGLAAANRVALSPDGAHVYATGAGDNALAVFTRDPSTGALSFVEVQRDDAGGVDGLRGASGVAVSPDGAHVYASGFNDDAVVVFARDPSTGALDFVEVQRDGVGGVVRLGGAADVALSPDGAHVYASGFEDDALVVFARDPVTGALSFVEAQADGFGRVDGLDGAWGVAASPDGGRVYVTGIGDDALSVFARNPSTGALSFVEVQRDGVGGVDGLESASGVAVTPGGAHVYATGIADSAIAAFATAPYAFAGFVQEGVGVVVDALDRPVDIAVSPDGRHAYVASLDSDAVAIFEIDAELHRLLYRERKKNGELEPANSLTIAGLDGVRGVIVSPDGRQVYAASVVNDAVVWFDRNPADGSLVYRAAYVDPVLYEGVEQLSFDADGSQLLVTAILAGSYLRFDRAADGSLTYAGSSPADLLTRPRSIAVTSDNATLFAASKTTGGTPQVAAVANATDAPLDEIFPADIVRSLVLTRDDRHVYTNDLDEVFGYAWNPTSEKLGPLESESLAARNVEIARDVVLRPDDRYLIAVGETGGFVLFARDPATGELYLAQTEYQGVQGIDGLEGSRDAAFTPDGRHLLVIGDDADGTVALFVPEPTHALLAASGLAALAFLARRRAPGPQRSS